MNKIRTATAAVPGPRLTVSSEEPYEWALLLFRFTEGQAEVQAQGHPVVKGETGLKPHLLNSKVFEPPRLLLQDP